MNSQPEEINVILCRGRKTDGTQCKAEIKKKSKYCGKCRTKVDPQWFSSKVITCHGQGDDGSICGNIFDDEDEYCTMCATPRPKPVTTTELKMDSADTCFREEASSLVLDPAASLNSGKNSTHIALSSDQKANTDNSHLDNVEKRNDTTSVDNSVDKEEEKRTQKEVIKEEKRTHESDMTAYFVTARTTVEAWQGRLQEESSNGRSKISANQDTNKDNTLHQGPISNLWNPDCIRLHFHVLVSPDFRWKMGQHKVYIDICGKNSEMIHSYEMEHVKQVHGYEEMHICILVTKQVVLETGFKYIYAIYNQEKDKKKAEKYYNKSDWTWTTVKYRSCLLPANLVQMNEYYHYDGIMNKYIGTWDRVRKLSKGDPIKKLEEDAKISAEIFTQEKLLSTGYMVDKLDQETLNMLNMMLLGLEKRYLQDAKCWSSSQKEFKEKMATAILSPILKSLASEIQTPLTGYIETQQQAERRMQVALFILTMIGHFKFPLSAQNRSLLAKFLLLRPHHQTEEFHDLAVIKSLEEKRNLDIYMADFCNSFQMDGKDPSWLFCIPLLHFLSGHVRYDQPLSENRRHNEDQWWGIQSIKSTVEKFKCCLKRDWMISLKEIVSCLSPLFDLDYFLPRTLMSALQLNEVEMVIQTKTVPPEVCIVTCTHIINKLDSKTFSSPTPELKQIIRTTTMLKEYLAKFEAPGRWDDSLLLQHAFLMRTFAYEMVKITFDRKPFTSEKKHFHDLFREVVEVFLEAMALYDTTNKKLPMKEDNIQNQMLQNVRPKVKQWLSENFSSFTSTDFTDNLERWQEMLCSKDFRSPFVAETWNTFLTDDFKKQWENEKVKGHVCESTLVVQYCSLVDSLHPCMQSCLHNLALKVIPASYQSSMQKLGVSERGHFGRLLSQWYEKEWEDAMVQKDMEEDRMILHHILKWMPFSHFLKMFYGDEMKCLSEECIKKIQQAISVIDDKVKTLQNGKITLRDLTEIKAGVKFPELTSIITENAEVEQHFKGFDAAKALLVRQKEVDNYQKQMKYVTTLLLLCEHIQTVDLKDLDNTVECLNKQEDLCVRDICQPINVEIVTPDDCHPMITAFNLSDEVVTMLEPLQNLFESNIFMNLWSVIGQQANSTSLEEVCENVWKPVSTKMEEITRKLVTGEIQFEEMEQYMGQVYQEDYNKMVSEMTIIKVPKEQADERIKQLMQFRQWETCFDGAKAISDIAKAYELKGDLDVIKPFISQKHATEMMKEFDDSLLKTSAILQTFTAERTACLNAFIECNQLVLWIQESVKDLKELKVFVDLALISAGDREMEIARVNCLHVAITGFAPLIFCLDKNSGYEFLLDKCQILWKELESVPNLPQKLRDTQRHLEWLKTVKQAHGSVEVTSLAQAEAINSKGMFLVGALSTSENARMVLNVDSTLRLVVPDDNKDLNREYTIEQLQDLQSRLMLIAWKAEQGRDDVDRFMLVSESVLRLANIFIKLNSAGCVLFRHWKTEFLCDPDRPVCALIQFGQGAKTLKGKCTNKNDLTKVISKIAGFMENCLEKWKDYIAKKRLNYFQLNHFTTDQLVILQEELVKVTSDQFPDNKIYPLLSAVKENCTHEDLVDAMKKALTNIENAQSELDKEKVLDAQDEQNKEEEKDVQIFIREMIAAGHTEKLARAALKHKKPSEIDDGIFWCMRHANDTKMSGVDNGSVKIVQKDILNPEVTPFQGWKKSEQSVMTITANIIESLGVSERDVDMDPLIQGLEELWDAFLTSVSSSVRDYMSVEHLGLTLQKLAEQDKKKVKRLLPGSLVQGTPNLILCPKANILSTLLWIYMMDPNQPLPQADEVLMCTPQTTDDQLDVFLRRALADTNSKIHCLVNGDLLSIEVSDCTERRLEQYMQQGRHSDPQYRLVVICSAENENRARIITALDKFRRPQLPIPEIHHVADYIRRKLQIVERNAAGAVDFDKSSVRVVKSRRAGVGKSLYVKRTNQNLILKNPNHSMTDLVTIHLQEKKINASQVTQNLLSHIQPPEATTPRIFHLDIAHEVQEGVDFFLFNLLILGCVTDNYGHVWRRSSKDLYLVETIPIIEKKQSQPVHYVHHIFHLLPYVTCHSPGESLDILTERQKPEDFKNEDQLFDEKEFRGPIFQRPYQYLSHLYMGGEIKDVNPNTPVGTPADCLKILLKNCGVLDPSWAELHHFVSFFNTQLIDFEKSVFCGPVMAVDLPNFSEFVLRFLIQMSTDFSTRSLQTSEESPSTIMEADEKKVGEGSNHSEMNEEVLDKYKMKKKWESSAHPYLFFNPDKNTITFLGFYIEEATGNLIDQQSKKVLEKAIMSPNLYKRLVHNKVPVKENFDSLPRKDKIERLCRVMHEGTPHDPDVTYELTTDNVKKILAIYMRFRCNIPVIIMGETGCGKTRLVKFLCDLQIPSGAKVTNMILMKVHGGTTNTDIKRKVEEARRIAKWNTQNFKDMYTVLFFDEANTTEAIGMIKEIICDRSIEGEPLNACENLKFVAACNPYRQHSEDFIKNLERAGLGYHVDSKKTTDRLGHIPMRQLVYRVQPLPQSLLPLVWDFGQLNTQTEQLYIKQMVKRYIVKRKLPNKKGLMEVVSEILTASQNFMRTQKNECSFVSLRDVERVLDVMSWFYMQGQKKRTMYNQMEMLLANVGTDTAQKKKPSIDDITRSLVLALGVCYHACLKNRGEYRRYVAQFFKAPCILPGGSDQMEKEISICQDVVLENIQLEKNIAKNTALKENVFMMVISIELRIPLFLVGKPGSSKSLAKTIVADAMQGNASHKDLFREFKQVQIVSFQCSPLSTPDGIVGTFRQCAQFQKDKDLDRFVSVVVLDEVGLAEDSHRMPLKTLHPLLEDGCQGDEKPELYKKVAFVGISNWALDPAKMNRGVMVQREVPDLEELKNTAKGICSAKPRVHTLVKPFIEHLAKSYWDLSKKDSEQFREFFGLRDFYSLLKMIYFFVDRTKISPTWHQLVHSIRRNFGGLDTVDPVEAFSSSLTKVDRNAICLETDPDCSAIGLIKACIDDAIKTESDSRYLLLLTENYGALAILQQYFLTGINFITVFGSSFPSDQEYTQVCRNINRIKVCMETGNTVILLNLENLYASLYDALNKCYVEFGGEKYVDLGLGTHRVKCRVHKNFRLIIVAEKDVVIKKFPIPLINRLEKHILKINTILTKKQHELAKSLKAWVLNFSTETLSPIHLQRNEKKQIVHSAGDVFIGYNADTCSSIILHVGKNLTDDVEILDKAKRLLLWCATPNYVVRLGKCCLEQDEQEKATKVYMKEQCHENLAQYLKLKFHTENKQVLFAQITTHSKLLSIVDVPDIHHEVGISPDRIALESLQSFDTERQFSYKIRSFMESNLKEELLLIVQCDSGDTNANLVASARYCIQDEHQQIKERRTAPCHVVLIIQLPRISGGCFTGFQCVPWHSAHIDELKVKDQEIPSINDMLGKSVGTLMTSAVDIQKLECKEMDSSASYTDKQTLDHKLNFRNLILSCVQPALAMIRNREDMKRSTQRIELIFDLLHKTHTEGIPSFLHGLSCHIAALLKEKEESSSYGADNWLSNEAAKPENINRAGTFRRACIQYLESKIFPVMAGIIAHIDTNHNLDLVHNHISQDWKVQLWLHIFNTPGAIQLQYSDLKLPIKQQELSNFTIKTTGCEGQMFGAVMPFSWLIYEQIDMIWRTAQERYGQDEIHEKMEKIVCSVKTSLLGKVLDTLEGNVPTKEIVDLYVQDFTFIVHHNQKPEEHELVVNTILKTYSTLQGNVSPGIVAGLVWIHESHHRIVQDLQYFQSINEVWPKCAEAVKCKVKVAQNSDSLALVNYGLSSLIQELSPQDLNSWENQQKWLQKVYNCRPVIEKGLACYTFTDSTNTDNAVVETHYRHMWTRVIVMKLFIEHVASDEDAQKYVNKACMSFWRILRDPPNFKEGQSLEKVEMFLKKCNETAIDDLLGQKSECCRCETKLDTIPVTLPCKHAICRPCFNEMRASKTECTDCSEVIPSDFDPDAPASQREVQIFKNFQSRCNSFFIDIISQLCFTNNTAPSDHVMDKLLGYVSMSTSGDMKTRCLTKQLTIFNDCVDPNPVFRSFLLQLQLRTSEKKVIAYLEKYFKEAESLIGNGNKDMEMLQLFQMVVYCLEDSYYLQCTDRNEDTIATEYLKSAVLKMQDISNWMDGIYFIAKVRFGLAVAAKHIYETILSNKKQKVSLQQQQLIKQAATVCKGDCKWPKNFFIKYLCRCFGQHSYEALCKITDFGWIRYQPEEVEKVREVSDRYIVCGLHYIKIRETVTRVVLGEDIDHLDSTIMDLKNKIPGNKLKILLCLTLHREITMSNLYDNNKNTVESKAIKKLEKFCSETEVLKNEVLAEKILHNTYGVHSSFLKVTPGLGLKYQGVLCLLMHCDIVLRNLHGDRTLLQPLVRLATQPDKMKVSFIPTMPQDDVQEIKRVILAHRGSENPVFYRCPSGHAYYIGDCGRPWVQDECPTCKAKIGGQSHNLLIDNKHDQGQDLTETGHILGDAVDRIQIVPERSLTPVKCAIIRYLIHLTMMLGANINSKAVSEFIKPSIPEAMIPQFLWKHIEHDLDDLHSALGKSIDDVFIIMHSILSSMVERHNESEKLQEDICSLKTRQARGEWEKRFYEKYVAPVFENIENQLKKYNQEIGQDKRHGSDPLQSLLYELTREQENISLANLQEIPSMWHYQSRITINHLHHEFDVLMTSTNKNQHRILGLFLKEEQHLQAIHYIPSVFKLYRILFQKYKWTLGKAEASKITVEMLRMESLGAELPHLLDEYAEVWDLVRENLEAVPMVYRRKRINNTTPLSWFLPALSGDGCCAYLLLDFLCRKQNDFLDHYYQDIRKRDKPHVKVRDITPTHLIIYHPEKDLLPLVLANCNYSFEMGKRTTIEYNFANLERQIADRFLYGKPLIDIEIELMVYRAEYTNATVLRKLQKIIPQVPLRTAAKQKISAEFHSVPDLYEALNNLDIAISFLNSIGGKPASNLDDFMVKTLKMKQSLLGPMAKQLCQYQHVKALWLLLSLENTRKLAHHNQVIFEGVPDQFHQQLSNELQVQVTTFLQQLSVERLEALLELMLECIVLVISVPRDPNDEDYVDPTDKKFKHYLLVLKEEKDMDLNDKRNEKDTDQGMSLNKEDVDLVYELNKFPDEVLNKFCVETWKLANQCLLKKRRTQI